MKPRNVTAIELRVDGRSKWVRVGFYIHKGIVVRVRVHDKVRNKGVEVGTGEKLDGRKTIFPATYDLLRPPGNGGAHWFLKNVEYREGDFYLDGVPLDKLSRTSPPLPPKAIIDPATIPAHEE